jgi:hypothetical protein
MKIDWRVTRPNFPKGNSWDTERENAARIFSWAVQVTRLRCGSRSLTRNHESPPIRALQRIFGVSKITKNRSLGAWIDAHVVVQWR